MGLLDKVKETAQKGADLAKEGVKAGQEKLDEQKLKKKVGDLKEELGGVVYAQKSGTTAEGVDAEVEIARLVDEINAAEAELAAADTSDARTTATRRQRGRRQLASRSRRLERRQRRRRRPRGRGPASSSPVDLDSRGRSRAIRSPTSMAPVDDVGGDGHVGDRRRVAASIATSQSPPPSPVSTSRAVFPSCARPATANASGRMRPARSDMSERWRGRRRHRCDPAARQRSSAWTQASNGAHEERVVAGEAEAAPDRGAIGVGDAHARFASTESRHRSSASSSSRSTKRGRKAYVRGLDVIVGEVVDGGHAEVLREQALLGRHVHDEIVRGEPVRGDDVERGVGKVDRGLSSRSENER